MPADQQSIFAYEVSRQKNGQYYWSRQNGESPTLIFALKRSEKNRESMPLRSPNSTEIKDIARANHFVITDDELPLYQQLLENALKSIERLDVLAKSIAMVELKARDKGHFPTISENPYGAWAWKCSIKERDQGLLAGKKIAVKDNVCVA